MYQLGMKASKFIKGAVCSILLAASASAFAVTSVPVAAGVSASDPVVSAASSASAALRAGNFASSSDGSLWVLTEGRGLLRIGRNGRLLQYSASRGNLPSDGIASICSDFDGTVWILTSDDGSLYRYSVLDGFVPCDGAPSGVVLLEVSPADRRLYACTPDAVHVLSTASGAGAGAGAGGGVGAGVGAVSASSSGRSAGAASASSSGSGAGIGVGAASASGVGVGAVSASSSGAGVVSVSSSGRSAGDGAGTVSSRILASVPQGAGLPRQLVFSGDGSLWIVCESAVLRLDSAGVVTSVPEKIETSGLSNLIHFEIETQRPQRSFRTGFIMSLVACGLLILAILVMALIAFRRRESTAETGPETDPSATSAGCDDGAESAEQLHSVTPSVEQCENKAGTTSRGLTGSASGVPESGQGSDNRSHDPTGSPRGLTGSASGAPESYESSDFFLAVRRLVEENYSNPKFGVDEIATALSLSRIHVNRKLKALGAPSPSVMLKDYRMKKAAELLSSGDYLVSDVAYLCGFSTPAYFATAFKEFYGFSPGSHKDTTPDSSVSEQ